MLTATAYATTDDHASISTLLEVQRQACPATIPPERCTLGLDAGQQAACQGDQPRSKRFARWLRCNELLRYIQFLFRHSLKPLPADALNMTGILLKENPISSQLLEMASLCVQPIL